MLRSHLQSQTIMSLIILMCTDEHIPKGRLKNFRIRGMLLGHIGFGARVDGLTGNTELTLKRDLKNMLCFFKNQNTMHEPILYNVAASSHHTCKSLLAVFL